MKKEKYKVEVHPLLGSLDTLSQMAKICLGYEKEHRRDVFTTHVKEVIIDTVLATDTQTWETGINPTGKFKGWIIVEQYPTREDAEKGHKEWVKKVKKGERDFEDIDVWGLKKLKKELE